MIPFPLAYLDWAKEVKGAKSIEETERHDWIMEFGRIYSEAGGQVNGLDIMIAKGGK
jgi:hypothetical protein